MTLRVIGAGFGRTGTDSLREALDILGFGPTHHMFEVNRVPEQKARWRAFCAGEALGWEQLLDGYGACVDWPTAHWWRELSEAFPTASVILSWRTAESWWESVEKTILPGMSGSEPGSVGQFILRNVFGGADVTREEAVALYEAHVAEVKAAIAPERLLVLPVGSGWEPLCAFLGVPVPDVPYPNRNSRQEFAARR